MRGVCFGFPWGGAGGRERKKKEALLAAPSLLPHTPLHCMCVGVCVCVCVPVHRRVILVYSFCVVVLAERWGVVSANAGPRMTALNLSSRKGRRHLALTFPISVHGRGSRGSRGRGGHMPVPESLSTVEMPSPLCIPFVVLFIYSRLGVGGWRGNGFASSVSSVHVNVSPS